MKLARPNGILSKLPHFVPKDMFISVYCSLFYTRLIYSCLVWSYSRKSNIDQIIKLQKKGAFELFFLTLIPPLILYFLE